MSAPRKPEDSAKLWARWYDRLRWYFTDEEAHEYAEEVTEVAEGRKRDSERSPQEIRRDMNLLMRLEALVQTARGVAVLAVALGLPFLLMELLDINGDALIERVLRGALLLGSWVAAAVLAYRRFWKDWLTVLRQKRLKCFWEWRSATLRFPTDAIIDSGLSDVSELPTEAAERPKKPPYSLD
ncbi:MAG: hypothetical protein DME49_01140 [Verrucomicrobia bacterium]|nr:MAG: hypothetical protein DME49_01140 [Verrucomicrobiota bacterium]PYK93219.1 MAG: hypothetical protein DME36_10200 [Verrucomicrobiota bacterium]